MKLKDIVFVIFIIFYAYNKSITLFYVNIILCKTQIIKTLLQKYSFLYIFFSLKDTMLM